MRAGSTVIELKNDLTDLERLAAEVEGFCHRHTVEPRTRSAVQLALEEVVTNIISYAYEEARDHVIRIELQADGKLLEARIEDDGRPFDPTEASEPNLDVSLEERRIGGLGMLLVRTLMDDIRYTREQDRNILVVTKRTHSAPAERVVANLPNKESSGMNVQVAKDADVTIAQLAGRLDGMTSKTVEQHLLTLVDGGVRQMVLDLGALEYISSVGLRVLILVAKRLKPLGGRVVVCAMQEPIQQVFEIAGFGNLFPAYASRAEAVRSLR
jgi:anti-anti-sigma factor